MGLFCLGAFYYFSGVAEDVRDTQKQPEGQQAGWSTTMGQTPPRGRSKALWSCLVLQAQGLLSDRADAGLKGGWKETGYNDGT